MSWRSIIKSLLGLAGAAVGNWHDAAGNGDVQERRPIERSAEPADSREIRNRMYTALPSEASEQQHAPLVSLILTTRDRPSFFQTALACYRHQSYANRELIVVDDGDRFPIDSISAEALGGRLIRAEPGTHLGTKLNLGCEAARGVFCQKMDDDDWYGPHFVETMVAAMMRSLREFCRPTVAFLTPFLFFDVARWEIRRSVEGNVPGASFLFPRLDWSEYPFRPLPGDEDVWFLMDQLRLGAYPLRVRALEQFIAVRHRGFGQDRGHTWVNQSSGQSLEDDMLKLQLYDGGPEALLPDWAIAFYQRVREESIEGISMAP